MKDTFLNLFGKKAHISRPLPRNAYAFYVASPSLGEPAKLRNSATKKRRSHISALHQQCRLAAAPRSDSRLRGEFGSTLGFSSSPSRQTATETRILRLSGRTLADGEDAERRRGNKKKVEGLFLFNCKCLASFSRLPSSSLYSWRGENESLERGRSPRMSGVSWSSFWDGTAELG